MPDRSDQPGDILIIKLGAFGDVLIAQETIRVIRDRHPDSHITAMTTPAYAYIMRRNPAINRTITVQRKHRLLFWHLLRARKAITQRQYDRVYDLQASSRTRLFRRWVRSDVAWTDGIIPALGEGVPWFSNNALGWLADPVEQLLADNHVDQPFILLVPGSSANNAYKRWPFYNELAERLSEAGYLCVTAPGPDEIEDCRAMQATMLMVRDEDGRAKPVSIPQLAGVAQKALYAIGNDTGPTHLAALIGTPGVALFGSFTSPQQVGIDQAWPVLQAEQLDQLTVQEVLDHVLSKLSR
ncbi:MAG: glycosyltransferase family 9 protein [Planctomycetota bacterium]